MGRRRFATGLSGVCAIDKPAGITSHDVVNVLRQVTGERRVGHTGTLDPLATGVLLVCVGPATRLADYLMAAEKTYEARICFGSATTTDDAEGEVVQRAPLPSRLEDVEYATATLANLCGQIEQMPPAFSAIKKAGVTAYKAARLGTALELDPRKVELYDAALLATAPGYWDVRLTVSKGFYVRSFARDLGKQLHSAAHLGALRRTASGCITVDEATQLSLLEEGKPLPFIDAVAALGLPFVEITSNEAEQVHNGKPLTLQGVQHYPYSGTASSGSICAKAAGSGNARIGSTGAWSASSNSAGVFDSASSGVSSQQELVSIVHDERLLALYEVVGTSALARPKVVIPGGVALGCADV